jgi:hypothetical protein
VIAVLQRSAKQASSKKSGWLSDPVTDTSDLINKLQLSSQVVVGIDVPRIPLTSKRQWYWKGNRRRWNRRGL